MSLMRPSINWAVSESALSCCLAAVWRNSWVLRSVRSVLVPGYHFHPCIVLASIFFLDCPYRVVHPGFWFGILPVGGWSAYSKSTNFCSCSSPFFVVLLHSSVFSKRSVVVAVCILSVVSPWYCLFTSCHTWSRSGVRQNRWPPVWRTRIVCFKSNLLLMSFCLHIINYNS